MTMGALVSSSLNHRSLRGRWYEAWSVALSRRGLRGGVDDEVVGGRLHRTVPSTVQWKGPNLGSDVGYRGFFVVAGRDPQCLILNHFKFIHMGGGPYGLTIWVRHSLGWGDGRTCSHQRLGREAPAWPSKGFHNAEGPRSSLDTIAGARAVDEMGIKHDAQDFRGSVLRGQHSSPIRTCGRSLDWWVSD